MLIEGARRAGLNRADLCRLAPRAPLSHGAVRRGKPIGSEFAGEVIEVGADVRDFKKGDRVMCHSPGSHAESRSATTAAP